MLNSNFIPLSRLGIMTALAVMLTAVTGLTQEKPIAVKTNLMDKNTTIKIKGIRKNDSYSLDKFRIGEKEVLIDTKDASIGNIYVGPNDTINDDVVTKGGKITVDGMVTGDCVAFGGPVAINGTVLGDIASFGGSVDIAGTVTGDVASFGGSVNISGTTKNDIASFGGSVTLDSTAVVGGDVSVLGGTVEAFGGAVIKGKVQKIDLGMLNNFMPSFVKGILNSQNNEKQPKPASKRFVPFVVTFFIVAGFGVLVILSGLLFPKNVNRISKIIGNDFWKAAGIGFIIQISLGPALLLITITILGIPLIPLAVLLIIAGIIIGLAGFGMIVNQKFLYAVNKPPMNILPAVALGFLILNSLLLLGSLINIAGHPLTILGTIFMIANFIVLWCSVTVGMGAAWITRLGTREDGPVKLPNTQPATAVNVQ
jgi:hypothetical protein